MDCRALPGARGERCLVFDSDGVVRRIWTFPDAWSELSDDALYAIMIAFVADPPPLLDTAARVVRQQTPTTASSVAAATASAFQARMLITEMNLILEHTRTLRQEQRELLERCRNIRSEMRATIESYAVSLRDDNVSPERAISLMKSAMQEGLAGPLASETAGGDELMSAGVAWGISAYFAA
jgi:hypothetical protein